MTAKFMVLIGRALAWIVPAIAVLYSAMKLVDFITEGRFRAYIKSRVYLRIKSRINAQRNELKRIKKELVAGLQEDGHDVPLLHTKHRILELAETMFISSKALSLKEPLGIASLISMIGGKIKGGQEVFSLGSLAGNGKTFLGILVPLVCHYTRRLGVVSLYLNPSDWIAGPPTSRVSNWLAGWGPTRPKLIILDSFNEAFVDAPMLREFLSKIREGHRSNCGFLVLYRLTSERHAEHVVHEIGSIFDQDPIDFRLTFNPSDSSQCRSYRHLFPLHSVDQGGMSLLLQAYEDRFQFHAYKVTRQSATFILRHLRDSFTGADASRPPDFPIKPPGDILLDGMLPPHQIDVYNPIIKALSRVAFELLNERRRAPLDNLAAIQEKLGQHGHVDKQPNGFEFWHEGMNARLFYQDSIVVEIEGAKIRLSERILAALHIARMMAESIHSGLSPDLQKVRGNSSYDMCASFVLPAYRRLKGRAGGLYKSMSALLKFDDAPFSFCAQVIHNNYDFLLLSREESESLSRQLFKNLVNGIDLDRRKTCEESICDFSEGPNPLLDQLFEVVSAYGDSVVRLLVDNIVLASQTDLAKSQGVYLILDWLKRLLANETSQDYVFRRRHHIYKILNGLEVLSTANLHIRFHVLEVLEILDLHSTNKLTGSLQPRPLPSSQPMELGMGGSSSRLASMPGLDEALERLLRRYSSCPETAGKTSKSAVIYDRCNSLVSSWATAILEQDPLQDTADVADRQLSELILNLQDLVVSSDLNKVTKSSDVSTEELEMVLECYEALLGITRRVCVKYPRPHLISFIQNSSSSPFWIVRWWAFYNISYLVIDLESTAENVSTLSNCLKWMVCQLYRTLEPIGLKHRQCAHLQKALDNQKLARKLVGEHFKALPALDENKMTEEYAAVLNNNRIAARTLHEYFKRMKLFESEYR